MANWDKSEYTTSIGIKPKQKDKIDEIRGKKSKAGKLDEVIDYYFENKKTDINNTLRKKYYKKYSKFKLKNCKVCGKSKEESGEHLEIHHIDKNLSNNEKENLMTLCKECHINLHKEDKPEF